MTLDELPLTPQQALEVRQADESLLTAWLEAYERPPAGIQNPVGWFVAGVRSGVMPAAASPDARVARVRLAELWIRNAGLHLDREDEVTAWLFDERGLLHAWQDDPSVRERMLSLWRTERPRGEATERARLERASRFRKAFLEANPEPKDRPKPAPYAMPKPF